MTHWSVRVERDGEEIVTIASNWLSGRDLSSEDEETIRTAAHHLLAFIGDGLGTLSTPEEFLRRSGPLPLGEPTPNKEAP
jgi:hypothetical protein